MRIVRVNVGKGYDVKVGSGLLSRCGEEIAGLFGPCRAAVVTDGNVAGPYSERVLPALAQAGMTASLMPVLAPGEGSKTLSSLERILEAMAEAKLTRADCVIALGGGVVGDLAGFAAGCYMRGVPFVQIPTTLLAAVDSSVGGKTAVDLKAGKNLAGLFHQPSLVLCDTDCLKTLPEAEVRCGLAEALKTGVLSGESLFRLFEKDEKISLEEVIAQCVTYKADVVERDEREQGERKLLNLGHTAGHAVELLSGYEIPHGLAVSMGLAVIARASARRGWCGRETAARILSALRRHNLPTKVDFPASGLAKAALRDKKRTGEAITLVIPSQIGNCTLKKVPAGELESIIADGAIEKEEL